MIDQPAEAALSSGVKGKKSCLVDAFVSIVLQNYYHNHDWYYFEIVEDINACTNLFFHGVDPSSFCFQLF